MVGWCSMGTFNDPCIDIMSYESIPTAEVIVCNDIGSPVDSKCAEKISMIPEGHVLIGLYLKILYLWMYMYEYIYIYILCIYIYVYVYKYI